MANTPTPGQLIDGYRFKGGDPADQNSWEIALPKAGEIVDGFRFKGGNPGVETSWEQVKQDRSFLGASLEAGGRSLLAAGARLIDTLNPFTLSEQDAATLFKDKPDQLKEITEKSASMALSRFANEQTKRAREVMQEVKPTETGAISGKPIGQLEYATTDPEKAAYLSPTRVAGDVLNSMPTTLALAVSAYLTKGAAGRAATQAEQAAIARGATQAEAQAAGRAAAIEAGASTMAKTGAVGEGAVGYAQQRNQTFDQAMNLPDEAYKDSPRYRELLAQGFTPEAAKLATAATTAEESGIMAGAVDAATNLVGGRILGKVIGEGGKLVPRVGKGFLTEAATETVQSAGEQFGQNLAMRNINPAQSLSEGVGEAAVAGGVVGGITGGVFAGALGSPRRQMAEQEFAQASNAADAARAADALAGSLDELTGAVDQYLRQPPASPISPPNDTQLRLESAALAGQEAARREEDAPRQQMISRAMANIEQRGGVASSYEAELLQAAGMGQPYNTIDPSLGRPASVDEQLTAATGLAVGQEAGLGFGARESQRIITPAPFSYSADAQGNQRTEPAATPEVSLTQAFVNDMRRTDTPAARAFVKQYDAGRITDADVQSALDVSQRALPQPAQQRIETAAAQAPAAAAPQGVQVAQELRSRGVSPVLAEAVQQYGNLPYTAQDLTVEGATARLERAAPGAQTTPAGIEIANVREQRVEFPGRQEATVSKLPRPSRVGGVLASSLTDEQLRTTAANESFPAITRRGAQIELLARQQEQRGSTSQPEIENATARLESAASEGRLSQPSSGRIILSGAQLSTQRNVAPGAKVSIKDGDVDHQVTVVDPGKLGNQGRLLTQVARIFGKRLVAFESESLQADGFVMDRDDRSIFINTKTQISPLAVFGHELTHLLKRDNPKAYAALQAVVERELGEGALAQFEQEYGAGANLEELTSDLVGNRFQEADFWQGVFDEIARQSPRDARSIITRLAAAINKAVTAFVRLVRQPGFQADAYVKDVNAIKTAVKQALAEYAQAQREPAMRLETETAQAQNDVDLIGGKPFAYDRDLQGARREIGVPLIGTEERVQASRQRQPEQATQAESETAPVEPKKATPAEREQAETYEEKTGFLPYTSEGQLEPAVEADRAKFSVKRQGKYANHPIFDVPLNKNGTVTLYYPATNAAARTLVQEKKLRGATPQSNRIYLTNESSGPKVMSNPGNIDQPMDGANVLIQVDPALLQLDQEYSDGRKDFFIQIGEGEAFAKKMAQTKLFTLNAPRTKALSKDTKLTDLERRITDGLDSYLALNAAERRVKLREARDLLKREHNVGTLLGENGKLEKTRVGDYGLTYDGKSVASLGLGLASAQKINEQNLSTCPKSAICEGLCLGETSGQNLLYGGEGQFKSGPRLSQYLKTEAMVQHPEEFAIVLHSEIDRFNKKAKREDFQVAIRLNVTSDFRPQTFAALIDAFDDVMFYDYTKLPTNSIAPNHHLTYSSTGASQVVGGKTIVNPETNWDKMVQRLLEGKNVAMAFTSRTDMPDFIVDERTGEQFQVWNGDRYDARFLDPEPGEPGNKLNRGMIVGLTNKDRTTKPEESAEKNKGFFLDYDRARDGATLTIRDQKALAEKPRRVIPIAEEVTASRRRNLDEIPGDELAGRKVGMPIRVEETGETATLTVDAKDALDDINEREDAMQRLLECLGK